jgi:hypothetical protein
MVVGIRLIPRRAHPDIALLAAATKAFNLGGTQAAYDAALKAAGAAHFRRVIASCLQNGVDTGVFRQGCMT